MQTARDTASRVCNEERAQDQANKLILVKVPGEDASDYFSLADDGAEQASHVSTAPFKMLGRTKIDPWLLFLEGWFPFRLS